MDYEETMVENEATEPATDDTLPEEGLVEETDESESLDSFLSENEGQPAEEEAPEEKGTVSSEPGWIKKRVAKEVQKALAQERESIRAEYDAKYAPLMEWKLEMDARELVESGKVKDLETAKELVRFRNGQSQAQAAAPQAEQPRNPNGQYAPKTDPATSARIDMLKHQADRIKANGGPDVITEFQTNDEIKQKVISGEMDFYDVADELRKQTPRRKPPAPMRSPNGASGSEKSKIANMSDEAFRRFDESLSERRYRV